LGYPTKRWIWREGNYSFGENEEEERSGSMKKGMHSRISARHALYSHILADNCGLNCLAAGAMVREGNTHGRSRYLYPRVGGTLSFLFSKKKLGS